MRIHEKGPEKRRYSFTIRYTIVLNTHTHTGFAVFCYTFVPKPGDVRERRIFDSYIIPHRRIVYTYDIASAVRPKSSLCARRKRRPYILTPVSSCCSTMRS